MNVIGSFALRPNAPQSTDYHCFDHVEFISFGWTKRNGTKENSTLLLPSDSSAIG